jgi:hypothetical protein
MRNILVHEYLGVEFGEVPKTAERDLLGFKLTIEGLIREDRKMLRYASPSPYFPCSRDSTHVSAMDQETIITVYEPNKDQWEEGFRRRRQ